MRVPTSMLHSNPSQKVQVGWQGMPFTFIAHAGLPPGYSHTCQTPWSVFLDGSEGPIPSAGAREGVDKAGCRSLAANRVPPPKPRLTRVAKVHQTLQAEGSCDPQKPPRQAESTTRNWAHPGFLLPISSSI